MLQQMRQNTKAILWVVVIAFVVTIFAVWGLDLQTGTTAGDPNIVGKVNGVPISRSQYQFAYQQFAQQMRSASPNQSLTYTQEQFIRDQAWDSIVYGILTDAEIQRLGISVSDQELVDYLRISPPPEIRQYFVDEQGQFDNTGYQAALNNPEVDWTSLEQLARERILRIKLNEYLSAQVHVSEEEILREFQSQTIEMSVEYVDFAIADIEIGDYEPNEEELRQYYDSHTDDFKTPEMRQVALVRLPLEPSATDRDDALFTVRQLRDQIVAGEDFGELAQTYSEAPTSFVSGNTGFINRSQREASYFDALEALTPDELSDAVSTEEGVYLLKLIEKQQDEDGEVQYSAQEILVTAIVSRQTTDSLYDVASQIIEGAAGSNLEAAAGALGLEAITTPPFAEGGIVGTLGLVPAVNDFAFQEDLGAMSDFLRDEDNIYIAQLTEIVPEAVQPIDDVLQAVNQLVMIERRRAAAERDAKAFYQRLRATDFETAADTYDLEIKQTGTFRGQENVEPFGSNGPLMEIGLSVATGETSPPFEWRAKYYVARLVTRTEMDGEEFNRRRPELRTRLIQRKAQTYSQVWYESLADQANIEDFRVQG